jgi:hypothetical protein
MRRLTYSMGVSLDGFIAGPGGEIAVPPPDEELHRFHNQQTRELGGHLMGRRLYEVMSYWDTFAEENPSAADHGLEFARIWKETPNFVPGPRRRRHGLLSALGREDRLAPDRDAHVWLGRRRPPLRACDLIGRRAFARRARLTPPSRASRIRAARPARLSRRRRGGGAVRGRGPWCRPPADTRS